MATLKVLSYAGVASIAARTLDMIDGGPVATRDVNGSGTLPGSNDAPVIVKLIPIDGDVSLTWPNGIVETISAPEYRLARGQSVSAV